MQKAVFIILLVLVLGVTGIGTGYVFAETGDNINLTSTGYILGFLTFPAAGIYYACTGFIKKFARSLSGVKSVIDYGKMIRTTVLGVVVGVIAFIFVAYNGDTITITTLQQFLTQVAINLAAVMTVDRLVLGGYAKPAVTTTNTDRIITAPSGNLIATANPVQKS